MIAFQVVFWLAVLLILQTYIGYPLGIYLKSKGGTKSRFKENISDSELPSITVFVAAYNEERWIARKIENALALDYPRDLVQIMVASDGSTDQTVSIAKRYANQGVEIRHNPCRAGKMALMNREIPLVQGEIVLVTDTTAQLPRETLRLMALNFSDPEVGCVTGPRVCLSTESSASEGEGLYWRYESWIKQSESRLGTCLGANGQIMAVRKSLFPYIPDISDDFYVAMKILIVDRAKVLFEPRAKAVIPAAADLSTEWRRKIRTHVSFLRNLRYMGAGFNPLKSPIWWRLFSHHMLRRLVPFAMVISLVLALLLWNQGASYRLMFAAQCLFYAAALAGFVAERCRVHLRILYMPFYFVFVNAAVILAWVHWMQRKDYSAWKSTERILPLSPASQ
jgi:biofilm PGA synthesis N-glycosyltransferase PgaC